MEEELGVLQRELSRRRATRFGQMRRATALALQHRKRVKEGDLSAFFFPFIAAILKDCADVVPIAGTLFGIFIVTYLFIFMWGRGRMKVKIIFALVSALDLIPVINVIPLETLCMLYAYNHARKDAEDSGKELKKVEPFLARLRRQAMLEEQQIAQRMKTLVANAASLATEQAAEASDQRQGVVAAANQAALVSASVLAASNAATRFRQTSASASRSGGQTPGRITGPIVPQETV